MLSDSDWRDAISSAARPAPVSADTYLGKRGGSASSPIWIATSTNETYVVKGRQNGKPKLDRAIVADQIVGRLGRSLGAPVANVALVELPSKLLNSNAALRNILPGLAHGSLEIPDCTDKQGIAHATIPANRSRFALLAVLFSWTVSGDPQLFYKKTQPQLVFSFDHGYFFPGGPGWNAASFTQKHPVVLDPYFAPCGLTAAELKAACQNLEAIASPTIAEAVASPPDEWGLTMDLRVSIASFLENRQSELITLLNSYAQKTP